jgi:CHASE2 domain-containing sensor protein/tRNA A-37 threonylcarbamoyl transferase component Bud32
MKVYNIDTAELTKKSSAFILYILITVFILILYLSNFEGLEKTNLGFSDRFLKFRGTTPPGNEVTIVAIDEKSLNDWGVWPWKKELLATLINNLSTAKPKLIVFDLFLSSDEHKDSTKGTEILAQKIQEAGNVISPIYFSFSEMGVISLSFPKAVSKSFLIEGNYSFLQPASALFFPDERLVEKSWALGHINLFYDQDRKVRKEPLLVNFNQRLYPSLALQSVRRYLGLKKFEVEIKNKNTIGLKDITVPTDDQMRLLINYYGPEKTFKYLSATDILQGKLDQNSLFGKIVVVGGTATELGGKITTPLTTRLPEAEKTATVIANILHKDFLKEFPSFYNVLIIILIGLFCALSLPKITLMYRMIVLSGMIFVILNLSFLALTSSGIITKPFFPLLELILFIAVAPAIKPSEAAKSQSPEQKKKKTPLKEVYLRENEKILVSHKENTIKMDTGAELKLSSTPPASLVSEAEKHTVPEILPTEEFKEAPQEKKDTDRTKLSQFGRYIILEQIGKGAMGTVYKGKDPAIDRLVALKTIRLDFGMSAEDTDELKERLIREAQAAGKLSHPNIVTIYDTGQEGDLHYIAMEYLEGYTLESLIKKKTVMNYRVVAKIIMQICEALEYAHQRGVVHRDIKPANIMVLDNFTIKVMDFGIARLGPSSMTQSGIALGTPYYISPEQLQGKPGDARSDIFALGVLVYELLTRQKPFVGENISALIHSILSTDPKLPSEIDDKTPQIFDRIVSKALAKEPDQRFQFAQEINKLLKDFVSSFIVTRSIKI